MSARVVTSWTAEFGTEVSERALEITVAMRRNVWVVSLPPVWTFVRHEAQKISRYWNKSWGEDEGEVVGKIMVS